MSKKTVCRCPACGSTEAYCDESRSAYDLSFMTCPSCGEEGFNDSWQVSEDWLVDIELADGEPVPAKLAGLKDGEYFAQQLAKVREEREARTRWRVMGRDTFAREDFTVGEYTTEAEAEQKVSELEARHAATQDAALRDEVWITKVELS